LNEQENELKNVEEKVSFLKEANAEVINIAECSGSVHSDINKSLAAKPILSDPDWELLIGSLNIAGEICNDYGIRLAYHHHMGTCVQTAEEIKRLLEFTDPNYVNLCVDTGHLYYAGIDPVEFIENNLERIVHVHFKDVRKEEFNKYDSSSDSFLKTILSGIFTVPGDGCIDFSSIVKILQQNHYNGWIIVEAEQDPDKADPLHYAISARNYLDSIIIN
jgi:inosose dehydratase